MGGLGRTLERYSDGSEVTKQSYDFFSFLLCTLICSQDASQVQGQLKLNDFLLIIGDKYQSINKHLFNTCYVYSMLRAGVSSEIVRL